MSSQEQNVGFIVQLLAGALAVGLIARRAGIPYVVALVIASLPFHHRLADPFGPQVLFIFLPALIFEAAWSLDLRMLARMWRPVALLAVPGVVFTALLVGYGLRWLGQLPLREGLLLGAIIAPTDPIAVIATFRQLRVPAGLATIVEGESLLNDGIAVALYSTIVASIAAQHDAGLAELGWRSIAATAGGIGVGLAGASVVALLSRGADDMLQIVASVVAAYGTYLIADRIGVSGIFAALVAGAALRLFSKLPVGAQTSDEVDRFWAALAFFANSLLFLLLGLRIDHDRILHEPVLVLSALALTLAARFTLSYGGLRFVLPAEQRMPWMHVVTIAGMRGALSLALALMLPETIPYRSQIIDAVFGVVIATLVVQGLLLTPLLRRLAL
jgi:CPA1 family monovalent cation:H+ antiporter